MKNQNKRTTEKDYKPFLVAEVFYNTDKKRRELNL
jgi:hypothetical protein